MIFSCVSTTPLKSQLLSEKWQEQDSLKQLEKIISDIPKKGECHVQAVLRLLQRWTCVTAILIKQRC